MSTPEFTLGESLPRFELEADDAPVRVVEKETWQKVIDERCAGANTQSAEAMEAA